VNFILDFILGFCIGAITSRSGRAQGWSSRKVIFMNVVGCVSVSGLKMILMGEL